MKLSKEAFITSGSTLAASAIYILTAFFATRILGPYNKGVYTLFVTFCSIIIIISNLSLNNASAYFAAKNRESARKNLNIILKLSLITSLVGIVLTAIAFLALRHSYFASMDRSIAMIFVIGIPAGIFLTNTDNFLIGLDKIKQFGYVTLLKSLANLVLIAIFVILLKYGSLGATVAYSVAIAIAAIVSTLFCLDSSENKSGHEGSKRKIVFFGAKIHPTNLISSLEQRADVIMLGLMAGPVQVGLYSLATAFAEAGLIVPNSLALLILPKAARQEETSSQKIIMYSLVFTVLYGIFIFFSVDFWVRNFFGQAFKDSIAPAKILAFAGIFFAVRKNIISYIFGQGKAKSPLIVMFFSLIVNVGLNYLLIPKIGINGSAISSLITYSISMIVIGLWVGKSR